MRAEGGLGREAAWARGRSKARPGERKAGLGEDMRSPDKQEHRWPPDGQAAHRGLGRLFSPGGPIPPETPWGEGPQAPREPTMRSGRPRRRRRNAGADPLGHHSFMESA
jgi:hypothetical protein